MDDDLDYAPPPHDDAAERYVLSAAIQLGGRTLHVGALTGSDFYDGRHGNLFMALHARQRTKRPVEPAAVLADVQAIPGLDAGWLASLLRIPAVESSVSYYAGMIRTKATARAIIAAGEQVASAGRELDDDADLLEAANKACDTITAAAQRSHRTGTTVAEDLANVMLELEQPPRHIDTPWPDLNHFIGGWSPGMLYVVGARPGVGKSLVGACALVHAARRGHRTCFASVEMSKPELYLRMIANVGRVEHYNLQHRRIVDNEWPRIVAAEAELAELPFDILDDVTTPAEIIARAQGIAREHGKLGLLIVDYLQLMVSRNSKANRQEQVAEFSRTLKLAAKQLDVPVLALAQLNRDAVGRRPALSDLRESGAIEQDADVVILLHRDDDTPDELELLVAKNRHGMQGALDLYFNGRYQRIESMSRAGLKAVQ